MTCNCAAVIATVVCTDIGRIANRRLPIARAVVVNVPLMTNIARRQAALDPRRCCAPRVLAAAAIAPLASACVFALARSAANNAANCAVNRTGRNAFHLCARYDRNGIGIRTARVTTTRLARRLRQIGRAHV